VGMKAPARCVIRRGNVSLARTWCNSDRADQASLEKINLWPAVHPAFDQLELGDLIRPFDHGRVMAARTAAFFDIAARGPPEEAV
jgi:hypothetical protein